MSRAGSTPDVSQPKAVAPDGTRRTAPARPTSPGRWFVVAGALALGRVAVARSLEGVLGDAQERVGLRPAPAFTTFSSHVSTLVTAPSLTSASSAALAGTAPIDSTMAALGPVFLDHAATLGAGVTNTNVVTQRSLAQGSLFGQPFNELGTFAPVLVKRTPTGNPMAPAAIGLRLRYALDLHLWATAVAVSHGFTDSFDASVVVPVVSSGLDCAVRARVVQATSPAGGAFHPVRGAPVVGGTISPVHSTGVGDLVVRVKQRLPMPAPWRAAATLEAQFPTGDPFELHGTGSYWVTPGIDLSLPLWGKRAELDAHAALHMNVNHAAQSQVLYGLSASAVVWPRRLAAIVEFLGQSQLANGFAPGDTDVLVLTPQGGIAADPLLGVGWTGRLDQFNFSFGLRGVLRPGLVLFANGVVPLNRSSGVRPAGVVPTVGLGWSF